MKSIALLFPCVLFVSCATETAKPTAHPTETSDLVDAIIGSDLGDYTVVYPSDLSRIKVPILKASGLGKPTYSVMGDGSYVARYDFGKKYVYVMGTSRPAKTFSYPPEGSFRFLNQSTGYYGTGNEDPEYTSAVTSLTAPDGRTANYAVVYGIGSGSIQMKDMEKVKFSW